MGSVSWEKGRGRKGARQDEFSTVRSFQEGFRPKAEGCSRPALVEEAQLLLAQGPQDPMAGGWGRDCQTVAEGQREGSPGLLSSWVSATSHSSSSAPQLRLPLTQPGTPPQLQVPISPVLSISALPPSPPPTRLSLATPRDHSAAPPRTPGHPSKHTPHTLHPLL